MTGSDAPIISTPYFVKHAGLGDGNRRVQARLASECRQQGVRPLLRDDLLHRLRRDRLHVGPVRRFGIGHDRRRVRVDEDDLIALLLERLARLGPGIVELAGLADDDRPGADDQNLLDVCSSWACSFRFLFISNLSEPLWDLATLLPASWSVGGTRAAIRRFFGVTLARSGAPAGKTV